MIPGPTSTEMEHLLGRQRRGGAGFGRGPVVHPSFSLIVAAPGMGIRSARRLPQMTECLRREAGGDRRSLHKGVSAGKNGVESAWLIVAVRGGDRGCGAGSEWPGVFAIVAFVTAVAFQG